MAKKIAGTCYVNVDGTQLVVKGSIETPLNKVVRETVLPGYYKETELTPYVSLTAIFTEDFPLKVLQDGTEMTVTCELANGKTYVLSDAYLAGDATYNADEGEATLRFEGKKGGYN